MRLFFSAGEPSGDLHAANLIAELRRQGPLDAIGLGAGRMQAAGCRLVQDMSELAVMGLLPVLVRLPQFFRLLAEVEWTLDRERPEGVVLIDYPGFNWHVARKAKERGIPVFYYGLPQLWAWCSWRVKKVQRYVDHALCKLPFEEAWFRGHGCNATYVGHPYFDELHAQRLDPSFLAALAQSGSRVVTLLPGSRTHEVKNNLPMLLRAGAEVRRQVRNVRLVVASYNDRQAALARELVAAGPVPAEVWMGRTPELISAAECCLACSGSVSLELLFHAKPSVIVYRVPWLTYHAVRPLIRVPYMSLVNLLASDHELPGAGGSAPAPTGSGPSAPLFPEYPTWQDRSAEIAGHAIGWLTNEPARQRLIERLQVLRQKVACGGASQRAAQYITEHLAPAAISRAASAQPLRRAS